MNVGSANFEYLHFTR